MSNDHDDTWETDEQTRAEMQSGKSSLSAQAITAALMSAESDIDLPGKGRPASVISNLLALKVGENYTKSVRMPDDMAMSEVQANMISWKSALRNSVNQSIRVASRTDNRKFSMETTVSTTPNGVVYVQVIVTRAE